MSDVIRNPMSDVGKCWNGNIFCGGVRRVLGYLVDALEQKLVGEVDFYAGVGCGVIRCPTSGDVKTATPFAVFAKGVGISG